MQPIITLKPPPSGGVKTQDSGLNTQDIPPVRIGNGDYARDFTPRGAIHWRWIATLLTMIVGCTALALVHDGVALLALIFGVIAGGLM